MCMPLLRLILIGGFCHVILAGAAGAQQQLIDVPVQELEFRGRHRLIGKLHKPLGSVFTIQGVVIINPVKTLFPGPNVRVHRINGRATQERIQIRLQPYNDSGKKLYAGSQLPNLARDETYEFKGFETGAFLGMPVELNGGNAPRWSATRGFHFQHSFHVVEGKRVDAIRFAPADFENRTALIEGDAVSSNDKAFIVGDRWRLLVDNAARWPEHFENKIVEGFGFIRPAPAPREYRLENGTTRLVSLQDQVGRKVALRGTARRIYDRWWFEYRGIYLYVENMDKLPRWSAKCHGREMVINGNLEEAVLPSFDQRSFDRSISQKDRELTKQFIVRNPAWQPVKLLSPERSQRW